MRYYSTSHGFHLSRLCLLSFLYLFSGYVLLAQHITVSPLPACKGDTIEVFYTGEYTPNTTFSWSFSCGAISNPTLPNPHTIALTNAGICTVTVVVTHPGGSPFTDSFEFEVFSRPTSHLGQDTVICEGACAQLPLVLTGNAPFEYSYRIGTELHIDTAYSNQHTIVQCPIANQSIFLMTLSDAFCDNNNALDTAVINVQPAFTASIVQIGIHTRALPAGNQYAWYSCDFDTYYGAFQQWVLPGNGCYACIVSNGACVDTAFYSLCNINCSFSAPAQICAGASATFEFTGSAGPGSTLRWTLDRGNGQEQVIENQNPVQASYLNAGNYMVTVTVLENGCEISCADTLIVRPKPQIDLCCNDTICAGECKVLSGVLTGSGSLAYRLLGPGTQISGLGQGGSTANIFLCPPQAGWYRIDTLRDVAGCTTLRADSVYLSLYPSVSGSLTVNDNVITASPSGLTYQWLSCSGSTVLATGQTYSPAASGCYRTVFSNGTCTDTVWIEFQLCDLTCNWSLPAKACKSDPIILNYSGNAPQETEFNWVLTKGNDFVTFSGRGPHTFNPETGCYQVSLEQTYLLCTETCLDTICVFEKPTAALCCDASICAGDCETLNITLTGQAPWQFVLDDGNITTTFANISTTNYAETVCPLKNATYKIIQVSDANGCPGSATGQAGFTVRQKPDALIVPAGDSICALPAGQVYGWYDCAGGIYFSDSRCIQPPAGCYCVDVSNSFECVDSACINYMPTSVHGFGDEDMVIYPNPVRNGLLKISLQGISAQSGLLRLTDLSGKLVYSYLLEGPSQALRILEIPVKAAGLYLLSLDLDGRSYSRKILVQD